MKIVRVDNLAQESPSHPDVLVAENVHESYGLLVTGLLNGREGVASDVFFRFVPDDYVLQDHDPR